jgi:hypothetical protein
MCFVDLLSSIPPNGAIEPKAITNARRLYNSCIDEDAIKTNTYNVMSRVINEEFGGWPSVSNFRWDESTFDLSSALLTSNQYNYFPFYYVATTIGYNSSDILGYRILVSIGS